MSSFFGQTLFTFGQVSVSIGQLTVLSLATLLLAVAYWLLVIRLMPRYFLEEATARKDRLRARVLSAIVFVILVFIIALWVLNVDPGILTHTIGQEDKAKEIVLHLSTLLYALLALTMAQLLDVFVSKVVLDSYYRKREEEEIELDKYRPETRKRNNRTVQSVVYVLALIFVFRSFKIDYDLSLLPGEQEDVGFSVSNFLNAILILMVARLLIWVAVQFVFSHYYKRNKVNVGSQYAINQLLQYFVYVIALLIALETIGLSLTVIWGGAAALLVGIGLGLQETFKDLFSGIILLFERSVEVGDVVEVDGMIGTVRKIGVRTSLVETRDNITVIVPNSKLIIENVINWSHFDNKARFMVGVGVAYGSDTKLVKELLLKVARQNEYILRHPSPFVRFTNFGDSSLDFEIHFWTHELIILEDIKSDLRFAIDQAFRDNNVNIPFPQRDVWMRS